MQGNLQCSECGWLLPGILDVSNEGVLDHQNMGTHKLIYLGGKFCWQLEALLLHYYKTGPACSSDCTPWTETVA